jgi:AraC-like DNA-binding protein
MDVLFDFAAGTATIVGTMTTALVVPDAARVDYLGARFRPGEAFALLGVRADEATDTALAFDGGFARSLADELASARRDERIAILDRRLAQLRARPADARVRRAVARIFSSPAEARVASLAGEVGASERHLERIFRERVGVAPKDLVRVARLRTLVDRARTSLRPRWAELAQGAGWSDQAHMIRDVKRLAGVTPAKLMSDSFNASAEPSATTRA